MSVAFRFDFDGIIRPRAVITSLGTIRLLLRDEQRCIGICLDQAGWEAHFYNTIFLSFRRAPRVCIRETKRIKNRQFRTLS